MKKKWIVYSRWGNQAHVAISDTGIAFTCRTDSSFIYDTEEEALNKTTEFFNKVRCVTFFASIKSHIFGDL